MRLMSFQELLSLMLPEGWLDQDKTGNDEPEQTESFPDPEPATAGVLVQNLQELQTQADGVSSEHGHNTLVHLIHEWNAAQEALSFEVATQKQSLYLTPQLNILFEELVIVGPIYVEPIADLYYPGFQLPGCSILPSQATINSAQTLVEDFDSAVTMPLPSAMDISEKSVSEDTWLKHTPILNSVESSDTVLDLSGVSSVYFSVIDASNKPVVDDVLNVDDIFVDAPPVAQPSDEEVFVEEFGVYLPKYLVPEQNPENWIWAGELPQPPVAAQVDLPPPVAKPLIELPPLPQPLVLAEPSVNGAEKPAKPVVEPKPNVMAVLWKVIPFFGDDAPALNNNQNDDNDFNDEEYNNKVANDALLNREINVLVEAQRESLGESLQETVDGYGVQFLRLGHDLSKQANQLLCKAPQMMNAEYDPNVQQVLDRHALEFAARMANVMGVENKSYLLSLAKPFLKNLARTAYENDGHEKLTQEQAEKIIHDQYNQADFKAKYCLHLGYEIDHALTQEAKFLLGAERKNIDLAKPLANYCVAVAEIALKSAQKDAAQVLKPVNGDPEQPQNQVVKAPDVLLKLRKVNGIAEDDDHAVNMQDSWNANNPGADNAGAYHAPADPLLEMQTNLYGHIDG